MVGHFFAPDQRAMSNSMHGHEHLSCGSKDKSDYCTEIHRIIHWVRQGYLLAVNSFSGFFGFSVCNAISSAPSTEVLSTSWPFFTFLAKVLRKRGNHYLVFGIKCHYLLLIITNHLLESGSDVRKVQ